MIIFKSNSFSTFSLKLNNSFSVSVKADSTSFLRRFQLKFSEFENSISPKFEVSASDRLLLVISPIYFASPIAMTGFPDKIPSTATLPAPTIISDSFIFSGTSFTYPINFIFLFLKNF